MSELITATIVVDFRGDSGSLLKAEIDDRSCGYNNGKTTFGGGDQPVYLVYKTDDVDIIRQVPSAGTIVPVGPAETRIVKEDLQFFNTDVQTTRYPITAIDSFKWVGYSLGNIMATGPTSVMSDTLGTGFLRMSYVTTFLPFRLTGVAYPLNGETEFSVLVYIEGEIT